MTREELLHIIKTDGTAALAMAQGSSLKQIEEAANTRFASVNDLYLYLRDQKIWPAKMKADSIYKCIRCNKFSGRNWRVLTPSFDDIVSFQTFEIEGIELEACLVIGVARAERSLAARISKEKSRLQEAFDFISGYKNYNPEPPETTKPDYVDAEFTEVPTEIPALPASQPEQPPTSPTPPTPPTPQIQPLNITIGEINTDRGALEEILKSFLKTTSNSNKKDLLAFRIEVKQALISAGLIDE